MISQAGSGEYRKLVNLQVERVIRLDKLVLVWSSGSEVWMGLMSENCWQITKRNTVDFVEPEPSENLPQSRTYDVR